MWLLAVVESSIGWPTQDTTIDYLKRKFVLRPESKEYLADVITSFESESPLEIEALMLEFCSIVAWIEDGAVSVLNISLSGDEVPARTPRPPKVVLGDFQSFVPIATDSETKLMLALYREALGVNSPLFSFFGFFKILNTQLSGDNQKIWIDNNVDRLHPQSEATTRLNELRGEGKEIGHHIYNDLRMAVIHASENHNVNPDEPRAISMLLKDLPLMRSLAELFIQDAIAKQGAVAP